VTPNQRLVRTPLSRLTDTLNILKKGPCENIQVGLSWAQVRSRKTIRGDDQGWDRDGDGGRARAPFLRIFGK